MNPIAFGRTTMKPHPGRRHAWLIGPDGTACLMCGKLLDGDAVKRGRSSARLGKDQERAFEKEHGPTKIGEFGDPVDHIGSFGKYQVKSTRRPVSAMLRNLDRMDGIYTELVPILIQRFVRQGVRTETFVTLRLSDWQDVVGKDE